LNAELSVLLFSKDSWLTKLAGKLAEELGLHLVTNRLVELEVDGWDHVVLAVIHDTAGCDKEEIKNLIESGVRGQTPTPVLVITDDRGPEVMIEYLQSGAADCVSGPVEHDRMRFLFDSLTVEPRMSHRCQDDDTGKSGWVSQNGSEPVCASSPKLANLIKRMQQVAPQNTNILMTGETGVGKTRLSRMVHEISPRRKEPFVVVNCAAMPTMLLESELFGHRRGAFTGADKNQDGKFSYVKGGTLLLDEVDTLSLEAQAKLLRTVESRVFEALGSNKSEEFRGRLIVATNQDLAKSVEEGRFRADLFYRLNVVEMLIPPLRERREEIIQIAESSIADFSKENGTPHRKMSPEVHQVILNHSWPGNIRELRNAIEQAMTFATGDFIRLRDLPDQILGIQKISSGQNGDISELTRPSAATSMVAPKSLAGARALGEKQQLIDVLIHCRNNRSKAAKSLGISRTALYKKLSKYGLIHPNGK